MYKVEKMMRINRLLLSSIFIACFFTNAFAQNKMKGVATKRTLTEILYLVSQRQKKYINFNPQVTSQIFLEDIFKGKNAIGMLNKSLDPYNLEIKGGNSNYLYVRPIKKIQLRGSVIDENSKVPISNIKITLVGNSSLKSNINGDFNFTLRKGYYTIKVSDNSYYPKSISVLANESIDIKILLKKKVEKIAVPIKKKTKVYSAAKNRRTDSLVVYKPLIIQSDTTHNMPRESLSDTTMILPKYFSSYALKTNLLLWGFATPNLAIEKCISKNVSVELLLGIKKVNSEYESRSFSYIIQPEIRYWISNCFNGFYVGYHFYYSNYGAGDIIFPFQRTGYPHDDFYEGYLYGMGASVGYQKRINKHLAVEGVIGTGYIHLDYGRINWNNSWENKKSLDDNYWGITKAAINIVYLF